MDPFLSFSYASDIPRFLSPSNIRDAHARFESETQNFVMVRPRVWVVGFWSEVHLLGGCSCSIFLMLFVAGSGEVFVGLRSSGLDGSRDILLSRRSNRSPGDRSSLASLISASCLLVRVHDL